MNMSDPWQAPSPPNPGDGMLVSVDPRVVTNHAPGQLPCPNNPPPPIGWKFLRDGHVPAEGVKLAVELANNSTKYPMGTFVQMYFGELLFAARVEWHSYIGKTGQAGVCVRGANLMVPVDAATLTQSAPQVATPAITAQPKPQPAAASPSDASQAVTATAALTQDQLVQAVRGAMGVFAWIPVEGYPGVEVMARPMRIEGQYVAVSARTAQHCADLLSDEQWLVQLSTVGIEDWVWAHAAKKPEPCLISPAKMNISCPSAITIASQHLANALIGEADAALIAYGKNWVNDPALANHPGRAANYGMPSTSGRYRSQDGHYQLWQPLSFAHDIDHYDYSQLLRLIRTKRTANVTLPCSTNADAAAPVQPATVSAVSAGARSRRRLRVLHLGLTGDDVAAWQDFLHGQGYTQVTSNGVFDDATQGATIAFQRSQGLKDDGWVGNLTFGRAMQFGFDAVEQFGPDNTEPEGIVSGKDGPNWPSPPVDLSPLSTAQRAALFGTIEYVPVGNDGTIRITNGFAIQNIVTATVNELVGIPVGSVKSSGRVTLHKRAVRPFQDLWTAWKQAGLLSLVLTYEGAYCSRCVRGRPGVLSAHAWGTAFDINSAWNALGITPALKRSKGSVRELVELANRHGWYWGGHFRDRPDGMHFELSVQADPR